MTGPHLNDLQFADYLLEKRIDDEAASHLAECAFCRLEFHRFTMLLSDFDQDTLRWSEARAGGSVVPVPVRARDRRPLVKWAMAACLLLAALLSVMIAGRRPPQRRANVPLEQNSREQIANDNQVLTGVYDEINAPVTVPMQEYGFPARRSKADSRAE